VLEDPRLEITWLRPGLAKRLVVVGSGGCTALSLLAAGAGEVVSVDRNATQHHLVELKAAAVGALAPDDALRFLGGLEAAPSWRRSRFLELCPTLSPAARVYWEARPAAVEKGALRSGVTERFLRVVGALVRAIVHPRERILRLRTCAGIAEQQALFAAEWDTWRWRALFSLLVNRRVLERALDPVFFPHLPPGGLGAHFREKLEHGLRELPVAGNYFLDRMLLGGYQPDGARPRYATPEGARAVRASAARLTLVDGSMTAYLQTCPDASVHGFALSNICEWMTPPEVEALFAEIARTAVPGAPVCVRNFVGTVHVPESLRTVVVEEGGASARLGESDRSLVNRTFHACVVAGRGPRPWPAARVREAVAADNGALLALAAGSPMEGGLGLRLDRGPDFFALTRVQGKWSRVSVVDEGWPGRLAGCVAVAERTLHLSGNPTRTFYASDLRVAAPARGRGVADALVRSVAEAARERAGPSATVWLAVLAGNTAMEARLGGPRGLPKLSHCARVESHALLMLQPAIEWRWGPSVRIASDADLDEMHALWTRVAPRRHFTTCLDRAGLAAAMAGAGRGAFHLAHEADGRLAGFLGVWNQAEMKRWCVTRDSARTRVVRTTHNVLARLLRAPQLPSPGQPLAGASVFLCCVPPERADVLRALLASARRRLQRAGIPLLHLALDARDPLRSALRGHLSVATPLDLYLSSPNGAFAGRPLDERPCHFELALA
jgi:S-adenosylmethionine-diacylglycerol 3-amino-3-carboxypropyl transferase